MNKFYISDEVIVINKNNLHHNKNGVIVEKYKERHHPYRVKFENGDSLLYSEKELKLQTKHVIKNELKGLLE